MRTRTFLLALFVVLLPRLVHADTISENFSTGPFDSQDGRVTLLVAGFDPALGTLTAVTASFSGPFMTEIPMGSDGGPFSFEVDLGVNSGDTPLAFFFGILTGEPNGNVVVSDMVDENGTPMSSSAVLSEATGVNTDPFSFAFIAPQDKISSTGFTGSVAFTYTPNAPTPPPVAATPEPSSIALLGTGLLGVAGLVRRRRVECRGESCGSPARC